MKKLCLILFVLCVTYSFGQEVGGTYKTLLYKHDATVGLNIHSSGWGINLRKGWHKTGYKRRMLEMDYIGMKHPKEIKTVNPLFDNAKGYFYGKLNTLSILRAGYGQRNTVYSKADRSGVEVRLVYYAGFSLGITKPVYLDILVPVTQPSGEVQFEIATEKYDPDRHFADNIYGRAPFTQGMDELNVHPGGYAKLGFSFEYGTYDDDIRALETGIAVDVFPRDIPIMALTSNKALYFTFYVNLLYGSKWIGG